MLENVRYKIANHFARKALEQIENGEIIKGMKKLQTLCMRCAAV